jgi:hypothetical protein
MFRWFGPFSDTERDGHRVAFNTAFKEKAIDCVWDVDLYGQLLAVGGGKERMTAHWCGQNFVVVPGRACAVPQHP